MASTVAAMASIARATTSVTTVVTRAAGPGLSLVVVVATTLQGVLGAAPAPTAVAARRRGAVVLPSATRAVPTMVRTELARRVAQVAIADARLLPSPTGSVRQEEVDVGRQDEGVVATVAVVVGRPPVALPIRTAVVALPTTRRLRLAIPSPGVQAISAPTGVATASGALVLAVHC